MVPGEGREREGVSNLRRPTGSDCRLLASGAAVKGRQWRLCVCTKHAMPEEVSDDKREMKSVCLVCSLFGGDKKTGK